VTLELFHPAPFGGDDKVAVVLGRAVSMLMSLTVREAPLPARSVQVPVTDCPAPWVETVVGAGGLPAARPDPPSEHWKLTVTGVLFQPAAFGAGVRVAVML